MKWLSHARSTGLSQTESQWHDVFRLFLLIQVVFGHMAAIALPSVPQLAIDVVQNWPSLLFRLTWRFGSQAAFLFVFLSGFMVAGPLLESIRQGRVPLARNYFSKRLQRIVPISIGAVLITALLDTASLMSPGAEALYRSSQAYDMVEEFNWTNFIGNLLFLQPLVVDSFGSNGPLWTLGYIVQYYIVGWLLCRIYVTSRSLALIILALSLVLMAAVRVEWTVLFISWLTGGLARHIHVSKCLCLPFLLVGALLFILSNLANTTVSAASSIVIGFLLTLAVRHLPALTRLARGNWLRRLSNDSYAVYAFHYPVLMAVFSCIFSGSAGPNLRFFLYVVVSILMTILATIFLKTLAHTISLECGKLDRKRQSR